MAKRKVPIKLTLSFDDAYKAYQKGKNTAQEPALLKKLYAAKRAVKRAEEGPYDYKKERPSTTGQRREAARRFGRQEETVEHEGRLQRIPGSVLGPNERFTRVTQKDKQKAADTFSTGVEIASYAIGAGQMIGLIKGAITIGAKFLTPKAIAKTGKKEAVRLANAATRRANKASAKKDSTIVKTVPVKQKKPVSKEQRKLADQSKQEQINKANKAAVAARLLRNKKPKPLSAKKAAAKAAKKSAIMNKVMPAVGVGVLTAGLLAEELSSKDAAKKRMLIDIAQDRLVTSSTSKPRTQTYTSISDRKDDMSGRKYKAKTKKTKKDAAILKQFKASGRRENEADTRGAFTKKMEKLLGLNRSSSQIMKDMEVSRELDKDLLKKGGKVKSTKKYAMNRGGKVASVRKPTRA